MEEIKNFVFEDVVFQLKTYYNVNIDSGKTIDLINNIIDEEYHNFILATETWEPDPYIKKVVERVNEAL